MRDSKVERLKPQAVEFLRASSVAVSVGDVAKHLDVAWSTARQLLTELTLEGRANCQKTPDARIFRARPEADGKTGSEVKSWCKTIQK